MVTQILQHLNNFRHFFVGNFLYILEELGLPQHPGPRG